MKDKKEREVVVISDVKIPFWSLVNLMIEIAIASIPVMIVVGLMITFFSGILGALIR